MRMLRIPVCPSAEVVFPGQIISVSERVYDVDRVLRFCREQRLVLGVVAVSGRNGHTLADVGTLVNLVEPATFAGSGPWETYVAGRQRFRIQQIHQDQVFLEATVSLWPWVEEPRPEWVLVENVGRYLLRYIKALSAVLPPVLLPDLLPPGASALGIISAGLLQLPAADKQRLLEIPTVHALLAAVLEYLRVYVPLTERLAKMPSAVPALDAYVLLN